MLRRYSRLRTYTRLKSYRLKPRRGRIEDPAYQAMLAEDREIARDLDRGPDGRPGTPWQQVVQSVQNERRV